MISVKAGTQTWSNAVQSSSQKGDPASALSTAQQQQLGAESLGEVANKVADPNYVDPQKARRVGNNELDKDAFLKLMLTQMKNQDPTNPLKSHEMAAQLAQFTSLEQLFNINETLKGIQKGEEPGNNFQALGFIGKKASGDSARVVHSAGDKEHEFKFVLPEAASEVDVKVRAPSGQIVRTFKLKNLKAGSNSLLWNAHTEEGREAKPGEYTFVAEAKATSGGKLAVRSDFSGRITGVNYTPSGPVLMIGSQSVRLSDVKKIEDAGSSPEAQKSKAGGALDLPPAHAGAQTEKDAQPSVPLQSAVTKPDAGRVDADGAEGNLDSVVMAGGLQNKIAKEVGQPTE